MRIIIGEYMNKRKGRDFELAIYKKLREHFPEVKLSPWSGCGEDKSDVSTEIFFIECKNYKKV